MIARQNRLPTVGNIGVLFGKKKATDEADRYQVQLAVGQVGEVLYRRWSGAQRLHLDCAGRRVEVLA